MEVTADDTEVLSALRAKLADRVGWQRFELWFAGGTRFALAGDTLTVEVPSPFYQDWLRTHFRRDLEASCREVVERRIDIEFRVDPRLAAAPPNKEKRAKPATPANDPVVLPSRPLGGRRRPLATLEEFVVGDGNKLAFTSVELAAKRPGTISPLLLYGPTGVGKTHLLESISAAARQSSAKLHAVYLTAERFTTDFLEALNGKGLPNFRSKYRGLDLLAIDDVQFFAGKRATLVELLHTTDTLLKDGKQLLFAADRAPAELDGLGPELTARLTGGLVCRMEPPDFGTRRGIVATLCQRTDLSVPDDVQTLIAAQVTSHARELAGALNRVRATSMASGGPITRSLAEEALAELAAQTSRVVRLPDIQRAVCDVFGLEADSLRSSRKAKTVSYPRMLAMFLARKYTHAALSEIGQFFGRRSHSTVISANKKVEGWMSKRQPLELADKNWNVEDAIRRVEDRLKVG